MFPSFYRVCSMTVLVVEIFASIDDGTAGIIHCTNNDIIWYLSDAKKTWPAQVTEVPGPMLRLAQFHLSDISKAISVIRFLVRCLILLPGNINTQMSKTLPPPSPISPLPTTLRPPPTTKNINSTPPGNMDICSPLDRQRKTDSCTNLPKIKK